MRNGLLIDYEWCTGCHSCEVACKMEHGYSVGEWGIHILEDGPWQVGDDPHNWVWNKIPAPTKLCDLCADRVSKGKEPTCVHHCLAQVMKFGPIDELMADLDRKPNQVLFVPDAPVVLPGSSVSASDDSQRELNQALNVADGPGYI